MLTWLIRLTLSIAKPIPSDEGRCRVPWPTLSSTTTEKLHICITTLSDANRQSEYSKTARRDFSDVLEATWYNKQHYATKHGYTLLNASDLVDIQRPPAWSKILAAQDALQGNCDWVFWMDPDSLIMAQETRIEEILPAGEGIDLVITRDATGFNAGMWMVRKSDWSTEFLKEWWSMTTFIRQKGDTKSGDNDALKALLADEKKREEHVYVAPQCAMNSYPWTVSFKSWGRYLWDKKVIMDGLYEEGDFILHFAGVDDKMACIHKFQKSVTYGS